MIDIRFEVFLSPMGVVCLRSQPGDFAEDVGELSQCGELLFPGMF